MPVHRSLLSSRSHGSPPQGADPEGGGFAVAAVHCSACPVPAPPRPRRSRSVSKPARIRTRTDEVGARRASCYTTGLRSGRPGSNGPLRSGAPVLCRLSCVRAWVRGYARLDSNQRPPPSRDGALSTELGRGESLRQESNPHPGRTKGVCLPLTLRRRGGRRRRRRPLCQWVEKPRGRFSGPSCPSRWPKSDARVRARIRRPPGRDARATRRPPPERTPRTRSGRRTGRAGSPPGGGCPGARSS